MATPDGTAIVQPSGYYTHNNVGQQIVFFFFLLWYTVCPWHRLFFWHLENVGQLTVSCFIILWYIVSVSLTPPFSHGTLIRNLVGQPIFCLIKSHNNIGASYQATGLFCVCRSCCHVQRPRRTDAANTAKRIVQTLIATTITPFCSPILKQPLALFKEGRTQSNPIMGQRHKSVICTVPLEPISTSH